MYGIAAVLIICCGRPSGAAGHLKFQWRDDGHHMHFDTMAQVLPSRRSAKAPLDIYLTMQKNRRVHRRLFWGSDRNNDETSPSDDYNVSVEHIGHAALGDGGLL